MGTAALIANDAPIAVNFSDSGLEAFAETKCLWCGTSPMPLLGCGVANEVDDRTFELKVVCRNCSSPMGVLRVDVPTLFGLEEDRRVLSGPWKVF